MKELALTSLLAFFSISLFAQGITKRQKDYLLKNAVSIKNNEGTNGWSFLDNQLNGKRMVLLGEPNHGSKEIFELKNSIIEYLHQKHGFDVLLLESGIAEMIETEFDKEKLTPTQMVGNLKPPAWRSSEFKTLMNYSKKSNLILGGFDCFVTSESFQKKLNQLLTASNFSSTEFEKIEARFSTQIEALKNRKLTYEETKMSTEKLIGDYQSLITTIGGKQNLKAKVVARAIENRIGFLQYLLQYKKDNDFHKRLAARDSIMASNILWFMKEVYPDKKVIIHSHNIHISKFNKHEEMMGENLYTKLGDAFFNIGMFSASGTYSDYTGKIKDISPADTSRTDIKHIIGSLTASVNYLRISEKPRKGIEWAFEEIVVNDTFIDLKQTHEMKLSKKFDALIFFDKVSIPNFKY
ncbi:MAG: erythromycin esterase family protein [Cyclobacteriaceae bacterium]